MKKVMIVLGSMAVALGVVGIFLPLLPTTPFLLLAAWLFMRSSPTLYRRLLDNRYLGSYIRNFSENRAIPLRVKIWSITLLWLSIGACVVWVADALWLRIVLLLIAAAVTWHILSYATLKEQ